MSEIEEDVVPLTRIQLYCGALYNLMDENSELVETSQGPVKTWTGYVTQVSTTVGIPDGVRNRVIKRLADLGCIQLIEQGRRNTPSVVAILYPPTPEVWERWVKDSDGLPLTDRPDHATLQAEVRAMREQIGGVDLGNALRNIEDRLQKLEVAVFSNKSDK